MLISLKLLTKYVIIISALGSVHEKFGVWIKTVPKSFQKAEFPAGLGEKNGSAVPNWNRHSYLIQTPNFSYT